MFMHEVRRKVMIQKTAFTRNESRFFFYHFHKYHMKIQLGDFNEKLGKIIFSILQLVIRVYFRMVMIMVLE